jgi:hypothetical protein
MRKLSKTEIVIIERLGLPENAAEIAPEDCTCGQAGCNLHQTWGARVTDLIFEDLHFKPELLKSIEETLNVITIN